MSGTLTVGSQYRFQATITKNGLLWDLTSATVVIYFKRPDGTTFNQTGALLSATNGQVNYDCTTSDLNQAGSWTRSWKITDSGGKVTNTIPVQFTVLSTP